MKERGVANAVHVKIGIRREPDDQDADRRVRDRLSHSLLERGRVDYRPLDEEDSPAARCEVGRDLVKDTQGQLVAARAAVKIDGRPGTFDTRDERRLRDDQVKRRLSDRCEEITLLEP